MNSLLHPRDTREKLAATWPACMAAVLQGEDIVPVRRHAYRQSHNPSFPLPPFPANHSVHARLMSPNLSTTHQHAASDMLAMSQVLGENAVLIRAMLEAVGVFARVLGPPFASSGVILRKVLLLLLERLGDPSPSVAASAAAALGSVCLHCGYPSRGALLAENADYLVAGLCRQLRSLDSHPR